MSGADVEVPKLSGHDAQTPAQPEEFSGSRSHNRAIASGVVWQGGLRWLAQVLSWTTTIVVARRLTPSDYGIAGTAVFVASLLGLVVDAGFARALVVTRQSDSRSVAQVHTAAIVVSWMLAVLMCLAAYPMSLIYREPRITPVVMFLSLSLVLNGATTIRVAVLQQRLEYRRIAQVEFAKTIAQAGTVVVCVLADLSYWSLSIGAVLGQAVGYAVARGFVPLSLMRPRMAQIGPVVRYGQALLASSIAWYLYSSGDFAILGRVAGLTALGYYQFAWNIAQLPGEKLANVLQAVVLPFFGSIGDDRPALRHYFLVLSELLVAVVLPVLAGFALLSPIAVPLIFGDRWIASIPSMQILVACAAMSSVSLLSQHVLGATGQAMVSARLHMSALVVLPPCFYVGARIAGPIGVAVVWLIFQPMLVGYPLFRLKEVIDLSVGQYLANLVAPAFSALVMSCAVLVARSFTGEMAPVLQIALLGALGASVYCATYWSLFHGRVQRIITLWRDR